MPVTARFAQFTWWRTYTCHLEWGIIFANVRNAASYSFFFDQKGSGPQKFVDEQPSPASDHLLVLGKVAHAATLHFDELAVSGVGGTPKSKCVTPTVNPYSVQYSKLRVTAKLAAGKSR